MVGRFEYQKKFDVNVSKQISSPLGSLSKDNREFKIYDATVAKTSLKIVSSSFSIYFAIMSVCLTFESYRNYPGTEFRGAVSTLEKNIQICA